MTYFKRISASSAVAGIGAIISLAILAAGAGAAGSGGIGPDGGGGVDADESEPVPIPEGADGVFPVRGRHTYGDGLGAGRDHQGQDLIAKCGKRVVAVQPGRVEFREYHGSAGNYVVIDGKGPLVDTAYMHLQEAAYVRKGEAVVAGQTIGRVGTTGNSSTCHLHFEMWSAPGWYDGGRPIDPEPHLRAWDKR